VPDFVPILGYADDVIVAAIAFASGGAHRGFRRHRPTSQQVIPLRDPLAGLEAGRKAPLDDP